jgi:hypothetical protein
MGELTMLPVGGCAKGIKERFGENVRLVFCEIEKGVAMWRRIDIGFRTRLT